MLIHAFFVSNAFFQLSLSVALLCHELSFKCCLTHISIMILRQFLYLLYLCPCLVLSPFMSYLCDLLSFSSSFFIIISHIISSVQKDLFLCFTAWKVFKYGVISGPYFPVFGLNKEIYEVNLCSQSEYMKITNQNKLRIWALFTQRLFFRIFLDYFWMMMCLKNVNYFQVAKVQPQGVA